MVKYDLSHHPTDELRSIYSKIKDYKDFLNKIMTQFPLYDMDDSPETSKDFILEEDIIRELGRRSARGEV